MEIAGDGEFAAPPFVSKTYEMVSDPANAEIISWGRNNNSFVVSDPFAFSQTLLPTHFKHSNFSSFVRQLNTYGFRKVDPDRWEFAHASFLRGQTHLLRRIVRKRKGRVEDAEVVLDQEEDEAVALEVVRLKQEQRAIEDRMERMWRRVRETERRPRQMLGFLMKLSEDPHMLAQLLMKPRAGGVGEGEGVIGWEKKARIRIDGDPPQPSPVPMQRPPACFGVGSSGFCAGGTGAGLVSDLGSGAGAWGVDPFAVDNGF